MNTAFEKPSNLLPTRPELATAFAGRIAAARLAIINPDRLKAELLQYFCVKHWGFEVVAVEYTGIEGISAIAQLKPEVVLVSLQLPDLAASEVLRQIRDAAISTRIVAQTTQCNDYLLHQLAGSDYQALLWDGDETLGTLGRAIERARGGLRTVSARIVQAQSTLRSSSAGFQKVLSSRELEVLGCIAHAFSDQEGPATGSCFTFYLTCSKEGKEPGE